MHSSNGIRGLEMAPKNPPKLKVPSNNESSFDPSTLPSYFDIHRKGPDGTNTIYDVNGTPVLLSVHDGLDCDISSDETLSVASTSPSCSESFPSSQCDETLKSFLESLQSKKTSAFEQLSPTERKTYVRSLYSQEACVSTVEYGIIYNELFNLEAASHSVSSRFLIDNLGFFSLEFLINIFEKEEVDEDVLTILKRVFCTRLLLENEDLLELSGIKIDSLLNPDECIWSAHDLKNFFKAIAENKLEKQPNLHKIKTVCGKFFSAPTGVFVYKNKVDGSYTTFIVIENKKDKLLFNPNNYDNEFLLVKDDFREAIVKNAQLVLVPIFPSSPILEKIGTDGISEVPKYLQDIFKTGSIADEIAIVFGKALDLDGSHHENPFSMSPFAKSTVTPNAKLSDTDTTTVTASYFASFWLRNIIYSFLHTPCAEVSFGTKDREDFYQYFDTNLCTQLYDDFCSKFLQCSKDELDSNPKAIADKLLKLYEDFISAPNENMFIDNYPDINKRIVKYLHLMCKLAKWLAGELDKAIPQNTSKAFAKLMTIEMPKTHEKVTMPGLCYGTMKGGLAPYIAMMICFHVASAPQIHGTNSSTANSKFFLLLGIFLGVVCEYNFTNPYKQEKDDPKVGYNNARKFFYDLYLQGLTNKPNLGITCLSKCAFTYFKTKPEVDSSNALLTLLTTYDDQEDPSQSPPSTPKPQWAKA